MRVLMVIFLTFFMGNSQAFEHWEHKRMGDLAYYMAMEIHCFGKKPPKICSNMNRETRIENKAINILDEKCETRATKKACDLFDEIDLELKKEKKNEEKLQSLNESLVQECDLEINKLYCEKHDYFQDRRWRSVFFFDPIYSGDQTDSDKKYTDEKISYGDVTGCVDYFLTPEKLMAGSETSLYKPLKRLKKYPDPSRAIHLFPEQRGDLDLSVAHRCFEAIWNFEGDRAAHVNHTHFQSELILSQRKMHLLAISLRVFEKNIFGALTANAISDHYLQDSLAPGHITAWRSRLTDVAANAYHDKRNRDGIDVAVDNEIFSKINAIKIDGVNSTIIEKFFERADEKTNLYSSKAVRNHFLMSGQEGRADMCNKKKCDMLSSEEQLLYLKNIGYDLLKTKSMKIKGDNFLWNESQNSQRLLLLVTEVRSILDVLESSSIEEPDANQITQVKIVDSFKNNSWFWIEIDKMEPGINFIKPSSLTASIGAVKYNLENSPKVYGYEKTDPIYGVSVGFDDMLFGDQQNRSTLSFERLLIGNANEKRDAINLALIAGVQTSHSRVSNSAGISIRGAIVLPQTETIISVPFRYIRMHEGLGKKWRPTIGLRIDQGFSSFSTFYLQVTHDGATQKDGSIRSGMSIGAGLGFAAPECRIPGIQWVLACR